MGGDFEVQVEGVMVKIEFGERLLLRTAWGSKRSDGWILGDGVGDAER